MANQEHLELLVGQGVEVWNQWRQEKPDLEPDLSGSILNRADLRGALLSRVIAWLEISNMHPPERRDRAR